MVFAVDINVSSSAAGDSLVDESCSDWIVIILMQDDAIKQLPRGQYNRTCVFNLEHYVPKVIFSRCRVGQELWDEITVRMMKGNSKRKIIQHVVVGLQGGEKTEGETEGGGLE